MTRVVDVATESVRLPVAVARVVKVADDVLRAEGVTAALISLAFVTDRRIASLNWEHLGHRGATDVISFGFAPTPKGAEVVGDVYIAPGVARRNAIAAHRGVREEVLRLVVHGILHVLGHDHPVDDTRYASPMWRRQERLLRAAMMRT